jgi:ABC-type branched-subunit amino acid transport system substrate-binding protein
MGSFCGRALALMAIVPMAIAVGCGADEESSAGGSANTASTLKACDTAPATLTIGATLPMSGSGAPYGSMFAKSLEYAVDDINGQGGIAGKTKLKLKVLDSKALAGPAVQQMRQLVDADKAEVIVSAYNDPPLAQATLAKQMKIPVFNGGGNGVELAGKPFLWNNVASIAQETSRIQEYAKANLKINKIAILAATNYTTSDLQGVEDAAKKVFGDANVKMVKFDPEVSDVKPQLQEIKAFAPDGITFLNSGTLTITAAKNASELDLGIPILGTSGTLFEPKILEQKSMADATASAMEFAPPAEFAKAIEAATKVPANAFQDNYASIVKVIAQAGDQLVGDGKCLSGANINEVVRQKAEAGAAFEGYAGPVAYTPDGGSARKLKILGVKNGKVEELEAGKAPTS